MHSRFAENLLALFTARDVSESIVGDLVEQRPAHGRGWFAREVAQLAFALCFKSLVAAPWRTIRLAVLGWCTYTGALLILFVASGLPWYPWHRVHEPGFWVRFGLVVFVANLVTGGVLTRWAPKSGSAIAPLTTLWLVGWLLSPFAVALVDARVPWPWDRPSGIVWSAVLVPVLYVVPLLLGALVAQRREPTAVR
jgi:hypothetical protein